MKKLAIILIALAIALSGCAVRTDDSSVSPPSWAEAYFYALVEYLEQPFNDHLILERISSIQLIDLDFDGTPEMILTMSGVNADWVSHIYSYQNGEIVRIGGYTERSLQTNFTLVRNRETAAVSWIAYDVFARGKGGEDFMWSVLDFSDVPNIRSEAFFAYSSENVLEGYGDSFRVVDIIYRLRLSNELDYVEMPLEEIEAKRDEFLANFEMIDSQQLSTSAHQIRKDGETELSAETLDRERLIEFFGRWE